MSSKRELREAIRRWTETTFAISRQRDEARAERDDIRDQLAQAIAEREEMAQEVIAAHRERDNLRADLAQARLDLLDPAPEPRPFRVGDRVRVHGKECLVREVWDGGDIVIEAGGYKSLTLPEFCTLIEPGVEEVVEPPPDCPAAANLQGEHIACDATVSHQVHGSRSAGLIWSGPAGDGAPDGDTPTPQPVTLILPDRTRVTFDAVVTR